MKDQDLSKIKGKLLGLTQKIYLTEPQDESRRFESFIPSQISNPSLFSIPPVTWWINKSTFECREDIAEMAIACDLQLQGGDKAEFSTIIGKTLRENAINSRIFDPESVYEKRFKTLFEARSIRDPQEFALHLWNLVRESLANSLENWLVMYPLHLIKTNSYLLGFDGLTILNSNDQDQWKRISEKYSDSQFWVPNTGTWTNGIDKQSMKDFLLSPAWLLSEISGTTSGARAVSGEHMRTWIAVLCSHLDAEIPSLLTKSGADSASYSIQFSEKGGSTMAGIGSLFPPLLLDRRILELSSLILAEIKEWYKARAMASELAAQRSTTASQFIHYGIVSDNLEQFMHFFIALDALFGEDRKVKENFKEGIKQTFPEDLSWEDRGDKLFDLRNDLIHGGISSISKWRGLDHYRRHFKTHPMKDIQTAAMTALRVYFDNKIFEHLFEVKS